MILESAGIFWTPPTSHLTYEVVAPFVLEEDLDRLSFAIGMGTETGFECSYRVAHLATHHFVQALQDDSLIPNMAFAQAGRAADSILRAQFPYDNDSAPGCTLISGLIQNDQAWIAWIAWIGSETAWHFRHASLIASTLPHTLGNAIKAAYPDQDMGVNPLAHAAHRAFYSQNVLDVSQIETLESPWTLLPGDTLIFTTQELTRHLVPQQVAQQLEGKDASQIAQLLLAMLPENEKHYGAAAIVIRVADS